MNVRVLVATTLTTTLAGALLAGCSLGGESEPEGRDGDTPTEVVLVTHESFKLPKKLIRAWEQDSGYTLKIRAAGDAGTLTNKLVLTKDDPTGDVAFGVDNTFATRALDAGVFAEHSVDLPAGADAYAPPTGAQELVPVDNANVCVNIDTAWFADHELDPPRTLDDLADPTYRGLFVTPGAATSSPGMAFLLAGIAEYGDDWTDYWTRLMANDVKLTQGWSDAYFVDFTQGGGEGDRPIVLSYDSSPAFTLTKDGRASTTAALLDTCFQQVEYAGILAGAANPEGAESLLEFLLSPPVQAALPETMYVFPVRDDVTLPEDWARFAVQPDQPASLDPETITANREEWLREWTDITTR